MVLLALIFLESLVKKNYKVKALVYYNSFNSYGWIDKIEHKIKKIEIISGDIRDSKIIRDNITGVIKLFI